MRQNPYPIVGVGGHAAYGGYGFYSSRSWGVLVDRVVSLEVVTADGNIRIVSEEYDSDLFWVSCDSLFGRPHSAEFRAMLRLCEAPVALLVLSPLSPSARRLHRRTSSLLRIPSMNQLLSLLASSRLTKMSRKNPLLLSGAAFLI